MELLVTFLSNPVIGAVGYIMSLIAACIAIYQAMGKSTANKEIVKLTNKNTILINENNELKVKINQSTNNNTVSQGEKSQYFQENTGPVNIDMRG